MMSYILSCKFIILSVFVSFSEMRHSVPQPQEHSKNDEVGLWAMEDCVLARFSMKFFVPLDNLENNINNVLEIGVPSTAKAMKDNGEHQCSNNTKRDQKLTLYWEERISKASSKTLYNTVTITFTQSMEKHTYGISRIRGEFEILDESLYERGRLKDKTQQNKNLLTLDSEPWYHFAKNDNMMFISPNNRSFSCRVGINVHLSAKLKHGRQEVDLNGKTNASLHAGNFEFDAFRNLTKRSKIGQFRDRVYCDYHVSSNEVPTISIPLVVMIALFIVFVVLFAFGLLKRRKISTPYNTFE